MSRRAAPARRQRGVVLLGALALVVISVIISASLTWRSHLDIRRLGGLQSLESSGLYALGGESWVGDILLEDLRESQIDSLDENWALALPPLPIDGGQIEGVVEDMQARLNLNNIVSATGEQDPIWFPVLQRLLDSLEIDPLIADRVFDWIDPNVDVAFPDGAEDDSYTGLDPGYRTANRYITHRSELLAVGGMTPEIYRVLSPHVAALPPGTLININTATQPVIAALSPNLTLFDAEAIAQVRGDEPFSNPADLDGYLDPAERPLVSFGSEYFQVNLVVTRSASRYTLHSLIERDASSGATTVRRRSTVNDF